MSKKLGVKIPPGRFSPNFIKIFPLIFLLEDRFLLDLGEIYSLLGLMKLAPGIRLNDFRGNFDTISYSLVSPILPMANLSL